MYTYPANKRIRPTRSSKRAVQKQGWGTHVAPQVRALRTHARVPCAQFSRRKDEPETSTYGKIGARFEGEQRKSQRAERRVATAALHVPCSPCFDKFAHPTKKTGSTLAGGGASSPARGQDTDKHTHVDGEINPVYPRVGFSFSFSALHSPSSSRLDTY